MAGENVQKRMANLEAFRCLLMFMIVLWHAYIHGPLANANSCWHGLFTLLLCWHVDGFLAISGWFGIRFSWLKFFRLYGVIVFYSIISMVYAYCTGKGAYAITGGWFGNTYLMLMLIAPLINFGIEKLCERPRCEVALVWGLFAIAMMLKYVPILGVKPAGTGGFSIITFVFLYVTARLLRTVFVDAGKWRYILSGVGIFISGATLLWLSIAAMNYRQSGVFWPVGIGRYLMYDSPHVWSMAFAVLLVFAHHVRVGPGLGRVLSFVSPSLFPVYLLHDVAAFGSRIYSEPEAWMAAHTGLHPVIIVLVCAMFTFAVCLVIDLVRRGGVYAVACGWAKIAKRA